MVKGVVRPNNPQTTSGKSLKGGIDQEGTISAGGYGEDCINSWRGGNPNPRFGNFGNGFKRGNDDTEDNTEHKEFDLRTKLRKEQKFGRMGATGHSKEPHSFNCSKDEHFQASCPNPPYCYNCM
jgi:hypothetical protein